MSSGPTPSPTEPGAATFTDPRGEADRRLPPDGPHIPSVQEPLEALTEPWLGLDGARDEGGDVTEVRSRWVRRAMPNEGVTVWGQDGCLWQVVAGAWLVTWLCTVPDADPDVPIAFVYAYGTDPQTDWLEKVVTDPVVTAHGHYYVFWPRGGTRWQRCSVDCAELNRVEVLDDHGVWRPVAEWDAALQQEAEAAELERMAAAERASTAIVGSRDLGAAPYEAPVTQILETQGVPIEDVADQTGDWDLFWSDQLSARQADIWRAPRCGSVYDGCR